MKDIVIIGAGPAGLTAAYELLTKAPGQYSVRILEGSSEIGVFPERLSTKATVWISAVTDFSQRIRKYRTGGKKLCLHRVNLHLTI